MSATTLYIFPNLYDYIVVMQEIQAIIVDGMDKYGFYFPITASATFNASSIT